MLVLHLAQNMHLSMLSPEDVTFVRWLLNLENNALPKDADDNITLPPNIVYGGEIEPLISKIYDGIEHHSDEYFKDRVILSVKNDVVDAINNNVLQLLLGESQTFLAANMAILEPGADNVNMYLSEYLDSFEISRLPPSKSCLKIGCPIILLRNRAPKEGLCNGCRLIVTRMGTRVIEARILTGEFAGKLTFIPRMTIKPSTQDVSFRFRGANSQLDWPFV